MRLGAAASSHAARATPPGADRRRARLAGRATPPSRQGAGAGAAERGRPDAGTPSEDRGLQRRRLHLRTRTASARLFAAGAAATRLSGAREGGIGTGII